MDRSVRLRLTLACVALAAIWLAMLTFGQGSLDRNIYEALYSGGHPPLIFIACVLSFLGEPTVLVGAVLIWSAWLWHQGRGRLALAILLVTLLGRGLSEVQKYWIARARPTLEPHLVIVKTSSFPSGHATSSMIFYLTFALTLAIGMRWHRIAAGCAVVLSLLIGISRVMLGVHWPSDVIAGWSFGAFWVLTALPLAERAAKRYSAPPQ